MEESEYCDRLAIIYRGRIIAEGNPAELRTRSMTDAVLEIACDRPAAAMVEVESLSQIREVALFGAGLHAVAADEAAGIDAVRRALSAAGFHVRHVQRVEPTLEDVFVSLVEAQDRAAGSARGVAQ
jgi:ABC-2 type transport system ATP-binding protein